MTRGIIQTVAHSKSKTFLAFCFTFLLGVIFFSWNDERFLVSTLWSILGVTLLLLVLFFERPKWRLFLWCVFGLCLGMQRVNMTVPENSLDSIVSYAGESVQLLGVVAQDPDVRLDSVRYVVNSSAVLVNQVWQPVEGRVLVQYDLYPRFSYGQELVLNCLLERPEPFDDFHYEKYLATKKVFVVCQDDVLQATGERAGNALFFTVYRLKSVVAQQINRLWHEPYASFVAGILYGYQGGLGSLQVSFQRTGLTHIVAVSGYNITIIGTYLGLLFLTLGIRKKYALVLVAIAIVLFVLFVGGSASAVRAGVMGLLVLLARFWGRGTRVFSVLVLCAALMVWHNPFVLLWDVGFQLSYLSTIGIIYLNKILLTKWYGIFEGGAAGVFREMFTTTVSATVFTLPLILFQFGQISLVSLLANILVLPVIPWIMAGGFISLLLSMVFPFAAEVGAFCTFVVMKYVTSVVGWLSAWPFALVEFQISEFLMLALYALLFGYVFWQQKYV